MKNNIILVIMASIFTTSCSLHEDLRDAYTGEQAASVTSAQQKLDYTYNQLQDFMTLDNMWSLQEHPSDECAGPTRGVNWYDGGRWQSLHTQTWTNNNSVVLSTFNAINKGLASASATLSFKDITASQKAQATFLQVFYMWNLTDLFGQTPFRDLTQPSQAEPHYHYSRAEAIDKEIALLEAQLNNFPDGTAQNAWIANKDAANALLAKLYLNKAVYKATDANGKPQAGPFTFSAADMQKVVDYCDAVIPKRTLMNDYFKNFSPDNGEVSTELIFTGRNTHTFSPSVWKNVNMTLHYNQNPAGWNGFVTLTDLYNKFEATDKRFTGSFPGVTDVSGLKVGLLVGQQYDQTGAELKTNLNTNLVFSTDFSLTNSTEEKGIRVIKYTPDYTCPTPNVWDNDWVFLRLADVMLMKAEALLRMGNNAAALTVVNQLRTVRGASTFSSLTLTDILSERHRELYWEGHRRQDQIRFSTFLNPVQERTTVQDSHVLIFPIPYVALGADSKLTQNPGY